MLAVESKKDELVNITLHRIKGSWPFSIKDFTNNDKVYLMKGLN